MQTDRQRLKAWMSEAIALSADSGPDVPVGCLIVFENKIIGRGKNDREASLNPLGHAELNAIKEASSHLGDWRLSGSILVSTLEPCPMCAEAIIQTRVSTLVFGAYDQKSGACGSAFNLFTDKRIYPLPEVIGGIEEEECTRILKDFFDNERRKK